MQSICCKKKLNENNKNKMKIKKQKIKRQKKKKSNIIFSIGKHTKHKTPPQPFGSLISLI